MHRTDGGMEINMILSLAMATYNGVDYLLMQLDSLRTQTRQLDEVIICDDRSSDDTQKMVTEYIDKYSLGDRWHFYINEKNLGYADNFHMALSKTTGDYVFFCDQDDIWCNDKVERMINIMEAHSEINVLCTDFEPFTSSDDAPSVPKARLKEMKGDDSVEEIKFNKKNIFIGSLGCLMCLRRSFIDVAEKYWYSGWAHDEYVWKLSQVMNSCYTYHRRLVKRRLHSKNVSMRAFHDIGKRTRYLSDLLKSHKATLKCAKDINAPNTYIRLLNRNIKATAMRLEMFEKHKIRNAIPLLAYPECYHSKKSILMDPYLVIRGK